MILVINEYTGTSATNTRKEVIASSASELGDIVAGHGSVAYVIGDGKVYVYDEDDEAWVDTDGNTLSAGGSGGGSES